MLTYWIIPLPAKMGGRRFLAALVGMFSCGPPIGLCLAGWLFAAVPGAAAEVKHDIDTPDAWHELVRQKAHSLTGPDDLDPLITQAGQRDLVLMGEATHGSHEFYVWRDQLSRRLITEQAFNFVAVEGDSAALARLNDYVQGRGDKFVHAADVLRTFMRWPAWMWRNREFAEFAEWLRAFNMQRPAEERAGLVGMDIYDPWAALDALLTLLQRHRPERAAGFAAQLACFARLGESAETHAQAPAELAADCLEALRTAEAALNSDVANWPANTTFRYEEAQRHMRVVANAASDYRASSDAASWNLRASHMWQVLAAHLEGGSASGKRRRGIVWAHNSHIGDAYYTGLGVLGMHNVGQLSRNALGMHRVYSIGLATSQGRTIAAAAWGETPGITPLAPAHPNSLEALLLQTSDAAKPDWWLTFSQSERDNMALNQTLGHRGIGVVYLPEQDALYYLPTRVPWRYDALIYLLETTPLQLID